MALISGIDWAQTFKPDTPILEIFIRGSAMYLSLFFLLRVVLKRQAGTVSISDLLLIVLIADAAQNGMAADYKSVTDGILLVAVLIFWNFALDWLGYRFDFLKKIIHPPPLTLIKDGRFIDANMRRELMTKEQIHTQLREQGIEHIRQVKIARMEGDGRVSVIEKKTKSKGAPDRKET
jgi:uncharacterized membrane protein YcaP (DUF421 family)